MNARKVLQLSPFRYLLLCLACQACDSQGRAAEPAGKPTLQEVQPLLEKYCFDCHGYGSSEGEFAFDNLEMSGAAGVDAEAWWKVLKNVRAGVMPPADAERPTEAEMRRIADWIKFGPFGIQEDNLDPGPTVVRRLNRVEYGNTVRSLMGIDFDAALLFPADDSGHGFDNVGDALMVSPLLMDKYFQAAQMIVDEAVPTVSKILPWQELSGREFRGQLVEEEGKPGRPLSGRRLDAKQAARVSQTVEVPEPGIYSIRLRVKQHGSFEFDPARYQVAFRLDGEERFSVELGWDENKRTQFDYQEDWLAGKHTFEITLEPQAPDADDEPVALDDKDTSVSFEIESLRIEGPLDTDQRVHPENYERFFSRDEPPTGLDERREYARETLQRFTKRAYRGSVPEATLQRLVGIAEAAYQQPDISFEAGIAKAMVAVLASPRFLFLLSEVEPTSHQPQVAPINEHSLASRLSYLLWSSMPDAELFALAEQGALRQQLPAQVERMMRDARADAFVANFVGQWLRTRDVVQTVVDPSAVLGLAEEEQELRDWLRSRFRRGGSRREEMSEDDQKKMARFREIRDLTGKFDQELKVAIRKETELFVEHIVREDKSLLDLLDSNYTFLNEKLAEHYGVAGVKGDRMRLVELPDDSPRGGVLTQASMLLVTSNPTRTSPVKRGLFVLDNILGTPAPPAPGNVPELEASADRFGGRKPALRELLAAHRESPLCASCHARMDPLGLALENFNALGAWRETDNGVPIDPSGTLITGEDFTDIRELKKILRAQHADDFYRCLAEKMLIYATGRGVDYSDEHTLDLIVERMRDRDGKFSALLQGVIESAPFQMQRIVSNEELAGE